jgi:diguanylate cyclase (GGDEF)-like protein/PAS domain S-box-containing protein
MNCAANAIFVLDRQGSFKVMNSAGASLTGYAQEELLGKPFSILLTSENALKIHDEFRRLVEFGGDVAGCEIECVRKDGTRIPIDLRVATLSEKGSIAGVVGTAEAAAERKELEALRRVSVEAGELRRLADGLPALISFVDAAGHVRLANRQFEKWFGRPEEAVLGKHLREVLGKEAYGSAAKYFRAALARNELTFETRLPAIGGELRWLRFDLVPDVGTSGEVRGFFSLVRDVTGEKRAQQSERERRRRLVLVRDLASRITFERPVREIVSEALNLVSREFEGACVAYGIIKDSGALELIDSSLDDGTVHQSTQPVDLSRFSEYLASLRGGEAVIIDGIANDEALSALIQENYGKPLNALVAIPVLITPESTGMISVASEQSRQWSYHEIRTLFDVRDYLLPVIRSAADLEARRKAESLLASEAGRDTLTKLPERGLFYDRLYQILAQARRTSRYFALMWLDLDGFKEINDSLGHAAGDRLLREVASRLAQCLRESDTVARMGGDEFAVLMPEINRLVDTSIVAEKILQSLRQSFDVLGHAREVSVSIGVSIYPDDGVDADMLMRNADLAMYRAKREGGDRYLHYSPEIGVQARESQEVRSQLRRALEREEFVLHYQPIVIDSGRREITGVEALIRWQRPGFDLVLPGEFIDILERMGLIDEILEWGLRTACLESKKWKAAGILSSPVALNLGQDQLSKEGLLDTIRDVLRDTGVSAGAVMLEANEASVAREGENATEILNELQSIGVKLLIDDFGTGYSSMTQLSRLSIHAIKIGSELVQGIPGDANAIVAARTIIELAHRLGIRVIAEAVESKQQLVFLTEHGCDQFQGFLFSEPVPSEAFPAVVRRILSEETPTWSH